MKEKETAVVKYKLSSCLWDFYHKHIFQSQYNHFLLQSPGNCKKKWGKNVRRSSANSQYAPFTLWSQGEVTQPVKKTENCES